MADTVVCFRRDLGVPDHAPLVLTPHDPVLSSHVPEPSL
jgi:hypothetical protein